MKRKKLSIKPIRIGAVSVRWPTVLVGGLAAATILVVYTYKLRRLISASQAERTNIDMLHSFGTLLDNPLLLAYKLPAIILQQLFGNDLLASRLAAVLVAFASCAMFYLLARRWYGRLYGAGTTALFAASSWMLHTGRYAAGYAVLILLVLTLLNVVVWINNSERPNIALPAFAAAIGLALFAPGGIWFSIAAAVLCRRALLELYKETDKRIRLASVAGLGLMFSLLVAASVYNPAIIRQIFGIPDHFPGLISLAKQAALSVSAFVVRGPGTQEVWLSHTPILDVGSVALLLIGILFYARHLRKPRSIVLLTFGGISFVLIALNGAPALSYLVPIVYLVIGGGLSFLLHKWKKIFPKNPIAEATALTTVGLLLLCIIAFHTQRYFIAWRYSPETAEVYQQGTHTGSRPPYLIQ